MCFGFPVQDLETAHLNLENYNTIKLRNSDPKLKGEDVETKQYFINDSMHKSKDV